MRNPVYYIWISGNSNRAAFYALIASLSIELFYFYGPRLSMGAMRDLRRVCRPAKGMRRDGRVWPGADERPPAAGFRRWGRVLVDFFRAMPHYHNRAGKNDLLGARFSAENDNEYNGKF
jgi:hypothetical protein